MTGETTEPPTGPKRPAEMPTGQVRIVGAERAADVAGASPTIHQANGAAAEEPREEGLGDAAERWTAGTGATLDEALPDEVHPSSLEGALDEDALDEDALDGWPEAAEPELLHWTEAPTGEVPAVLARPGDEPRGAVPEPSWRESPEDWDVDEAAGSPILEPGGAEAVTETDPSERQPWSFDLGTPHAGSGPEGLGGLDELEDLDTTELFAPWPEAGSRNPRPAVPGLGARTPPEDAASGSGRPGEGLVHGTGQVEPAEREEELEGVQGHLATDARPGPGTSGATPDVAEIAGERTSVLPIVETTSHAHARETHEEEAAALDADLQEHGLRRRLQMRRPETVRGTTARHRARAVAVTAPPRPTAAKARPEDRVSRRAGRNIPVAVASGLVIGALALVAFHFGSVPSLVVVSVVLALAAAEAYAAFRRAGYRPVTVLGIAAVAGVLVGAYDRTFEALPVVLVVLVAFTFLWHLVGVDAKADPVRSTAATVLVFCWVGVFGSFAALLLAPSLFPHRHGIAYLLGALIAAVAYDVGALAVGATLGRHPLSAVSPSKTWEGVAGGAVAAIVLAIAVVRLVHPWTLGEAAALGIVVAVVSPIGDLCESLVKRHLGIKDMGRILPGHGGLLDRVDGLLFVLPATYYLVRAFGHG